MSQMSTEERLVYMANQIARNFATGGEEKAAVATADHIVTFWDPRMKERIFAFRADGREGLSMAAAKAVDRLRQIGAPPAQTPATQFSKVDDVGLSDAG